MNRKPLFETNPHLRNSPEAIRRRIRSVASSTAIETGESVATIEAKLKHLRSSPPRVPLG